MTPTGRLYRFAAAGWSFSVPAMTGPDTTRRQPSGSPGPAEFHDEPTRLG